VRRPSENERKSLAGQISSAVTGAFTAGIISQKIALQELKNSTDLTGMWQSITDEDIEKANDTVLGGDLEMPLDLFGEPPEPESNADAEDAMQQNMSELAKEVRRMKPYLQELM